MPVKGRSPTSPPYLKTAGGLMKINTIIFIFLLAMLIVLPFLFARVLISLCLIINTVAMYKKYKQ